MRYIAFKSGSPMRYNEHDYSNLERSLKLASIKSLYIRNDPCCVKCERVVCLFEERNLSYTLRAPREFQEQFSARNYVYYSTVHRLGRKWNALPHQIRNIHSLAIFKHKLLFIVI